MATVDITEYEKLAQDSAGSRIAAGVEPSRTVQQVAVTGASVQSGAFNEVTRFIRVHTDTNIRIAFGVDPAASGASQRMPANSTEYFGVTRGTKLAVIASS